jgi:hypothetical protein
LFAARDAMTIGASFMAQPFMLAKFQETFGESMQHHAHVVPQIIGPALVTKS